MPRKTALAEPEQPKLACPFCDGDARSVLHRMLQPGNVVIQCPNVEIIMTPGRARLVYAG